MFCYKLLPTSSLPSRVTSLCLTLLPPAQVQAWGITAVPPPVSRWCNCSTHIPKLEAGQAGRRSWQGQSCPKAHLLVPDPTIHAAPKKRPSIGYPEKRGARHFTSPPAPACLDLGPRVFPGTTSAFQHPPRCPKGTTTPVMILLRSSQRLPTGLEEETPAQHALLPSATHTTLPGAASTLTRTPLLHSQAPAGARAQVGRRPLSI